MINIYSNFAYIYDKLMYDVNYEERADFIEKIFKKNHLSPKLILDLGCGTGNFTLEMSKRGYEMIGIDISVDMLACAKEKAFSKGEEILFLNQDMTNFELFGTVDAIISLMDSVNYITDKRDLKRFLKLVKNYLDPKGIFIFDINSSYKLSTILGNNFFFDDGEDITYIWQNTFDKGKKICEFDLTFFIREDDRFKRYDELHRERAYEIEEIKCLINEAGLKLVGLYDELVFKAPNKKSERIFFVCINE